jgi:hypothetical protein
MVIPSSAVLNVLQPPWSTAFRLVLRAMTEPQSIGWKSTFSPSLRSGARAGCGAAGTPSFYAGGKVAKFERIEWIVQPDEATAAAALQKGEVDWVEQPLIDLRPLLKRSPDVLVKVIDPFGWHPILQRNHLHPPFNNPKLRRAASAGNRSESLCRVGNRGPVRSRSPAGRLFLRRPADGEPCGARGPHKAAQSRIGEGAGGEVGLRR